MIKYSSSPGLRIFGINVRNEIETEPKKPKRKKKKKNQRKFISVQTISSSQ